MDWKVDAQPPQDRIPDARRSGAPRAGVARPLGEGAPVRAHARGPPARRGAGVRAARRAALRHRRHPLRHRAQQGAQGHRRPLADADGQARRVPARLGLPRPADRAPGGEEPGQGRPGAGLGRVPPALRGARAEVRRRHAHRVQAPRLPRQLGRSLPDAGQGLRGDDRAPAGRASSKAGSSTATRSRCTGASSTAPRWPRRRSNTTSTPRRRSTSASRSSATSARPSRACATSAPRSSSGRRRPGRCRRTSRSSPTPSWTTSRSRATANT